jgi:rhodanese-related sulfurtransferase
VKLTGLLKLVVLSCLGVSFAVAGDLDDYAAGLRKKFPDVRTISTAELAGLDVSARPLLLDAREENEFAVSHLPGARRAEKDFATQLKRLGVSKERPIVVYCSVGYRSALLAQKLSKAGFSHVQNLEGSIFAWANEGRPLVNANGTTSGAHPFNILWGRYLDKSKWRWEPEPAP